MNVKKEYKQTEIGIIPEDWEVKRLGEVSDVNPINTEIIPNEFIYIDLESVVNGQLVKKQRILKKYAPSRAQRFVKNGDILFQTVRPYQKNNLHFKEKGEYVASTGYALLRSKIDSNYLYIKLHTDYFVNVVMDLCTGTSYPAISPSNLKNISISVPSSIPEQSAIATVLSDIDEYILSLERLIAKKQAIKQGAMQNLLTGKIRLKGFEGEWVVKKLGEIGEFYSGGTPNTNVSEYYNGNIPFIKSGEISQNKTEQYITEDALKNSASKIVNKGDILYALYGATSGECAISQINGAINQAVLCVKTKECAKYILCFLQLNKDKFLNRYLQGGQGNLSADIVKSFEISLPTLAEQTAIATILSDMDAEIEALQAKLNKARQVKQGAMQQLLTGKIRLNQDFNIKKTRKS